MDREVWTWTANQKSFKVDSDHPVHVQSIYKTAELCMGNDNTRVT
jgi:hypothetical protein